MNCCYKFNTWLQLHFKGQLPIKVYDSQLYQERPVCALYDA